MVLKSLITVKVSIHDSVELSKMLLRQSSGRRGVWGNCRFYVNEPVERCDWWIVCHGAALQHSESVLCDPEHIVYISMEPTEQWVPSAFHKQFSKLILCDREKKHRNIVYANGLSWWVGFDVRESNKRYDLFDTGRLDYDRLKRMTVPAKKNKISVICSSANSIPGHYKRKAFIDRLHAHPVSQYIDFFGSGHMPVVDKWDAIAPYKYHLALENTATQDYWSEKIADSFLGFALPLYYGCPNIHDYFDGGALKVIDIDDFEGSVAMIESLFEQDSYTECLDAIFHAREQVLDRYNLFQMMSESCDGRAENLSVCTLRSVQDLNQRWLKRVTRFVRSLIFNR